MNQRQKEVQQVYLNSEKAVLKKLEKNYRDALYEINDKIAMLVGRDDADMQHVIYQIEYHEALKKQTEAILETLHTNEFQTISEYLTKSYEDGFIGTMYDLQGQGIPLVIPIDQEQVAAAIQHETKLSDNLYKSLGKDTKRLSGQIAGEISRGISNAATYSEMSRNIASLSSIHKNNAARIARTEAHRIQCQATANAQFKAKEKGADVVKIWDASLDGKTRPHHRELDGQLRELEEPFEVAGYEVMQPGAFGDPGEDCNCRCALLQRARWALGRDFTKWDKESGGIVEIEAKDYKDFKNKYMTEAEGMMKYRGLGAKIGGNGIPEHEEPALIGKIDYNNRKAVKKELNAFEKDAIKESIETACVITNEGEIYKCFGINDRVFPDFDLKDKLEGASVSHNHPIEETAYSFSSDDLSLFMDYKLDVLRGCDEVYSYEFTRDSEDIDNDPEDWMNFENYQHADIIRLAKQHGIGYRRWKND